VPDWKMAKYSSTQFKRHQGSLLINEGEKHQKTKK
jgi:hypothetical protein